MPVSSDEKLQLIKNAVSEMALLGYRLDKLLLGFKLYQEKKGTLDIAEYEQVLEVYNTAINAMEEQMQRYHRLFTCIESMIE